MCGKKSDDFRTSVLNIPFARKVLDRDEETNQDSMGNQGTAMQGE
jgi:hypothetical protein